MKKMKWMLMAVVAFGMLAATPASAQRKAPDPEKRFAKMDKDGDGKISLEEFQAAKVGRGRRAQSAKPDPERRAKAFKRFDTDGDGFLSKEEFLAMVDTAKQRQGQPKPQ